MNIGANSVTDTGLYFQWGDTQGYTAAQVGSGSDKKYFGWADYKYCSGAGTSSSAMTKYNSTDGKKVLESVDDAATVNWGGSWRMPTTAEFQALGNAVNTAWTTNYLESGIAGLVCTDKKDSSKVLFFPACGICYTGSAHDVGSKGYYWSNSLSTNISPLGGNFQEAHYLLFNNDFVLQSSERRFYGFPVRGVINE